MHEKNGHMLAWWGILIAVVMAVVFFLVGGWSAFGGPFPTTGGDPALQHSEEAYEESIEANRRLVEAWWDHQIFSWKWWVNVGMTVIPWLAWVYIRRKDSTDRLLYLGLVMIVLASFMDFLGVSYGFWRYHVEVFPSIPSYIPWDFTLYPVAAMVLFQFEPRVSKYLKALWFATSATFLVEPAFIWLKFYEPYNWSVFYSFPIHFVNYLIAHWAGTRRAFEPLMPESVPAWNPPDHKQRPN